MKFSILINQVGAASSGLADETDLIDWAMLDYISAWQAHPSATRRGEMVWLNYRNFIEQMPLLGLRTKQAVSRRIAKLRKLGLIETEQDEEKRLFVRVTEFFCRIVSFSSVYNSGEGCQPNEGGVNCGGQGVNCGGQGVNCGGHSINHKIKPKETVNSNARARETVDNCERVVAAEEEYLDETVFLSCMDWAQFFIREKGMPFHLVQTPRTIPVFEDWVSKAISVGDVRMAIAAAEAWSGCPADSPMLYARFLTSILTERGKQAAGRAFSSSIVRRSVPEWAMIPRDDNALGEWAGKNGYPAASAGMSYPQYREKLRGLVDRRLSDGRHG